MGCNPSKDGGGGGGGGAVSAATSKASSSAAASAADNYVADRVFIPLTDDSGERNSSTSSIGKGETAETMKTAEEVTDFEKEFRPDDVELCHAATKIQASFRGHMTRKQQAGGKDDPSGATASAAGSKAESLESKLKNVNINKDAELEQMLADVDLADPELHKAATKIQASFRGHKARKADDAVDAKQ